MTMTEKQTALFDKLRQRDPRVVMDGIVDENKYLCAPIKIVYVLKEVNGGDGWNLVDYLKDGGRAQTWDTIARWTEALFDVKRGAEEKEWSYWCQNGKQRRLHYLPYIGAVNLKKTSGGNTSIKKEVDQAAISNREILRQQMELYHPDVILCCGTADAFVSSYCDGKADWKSTKRGIRYTLWGQQIILAFSHPAARVDPCYLHYALMDGMKEILQQQKN